MPHEVQIEEVFPRLTAEGSRFNLGQIQIAQRECTERAKQRARYILCRKHKRRLESWGFEIQMIRGCPAPGLSTLLFEKKESGVILPIVFNRSAENSRTVDFSRIGRGDRSCIRELFLHQH